MSLTVGSLFSGIGGIDLGLERAGMRVAWQCEKDPAARRVLNRRWPGVPVYDDVEELTSDRAATVDVLCGGFPCQDLSVAGRRAGLAGERSGLFHQFMRLADELAPRWVLVENVPGLLSSNDGADMGVVLGTLADLGYGWCYRVLDAQYFGVAQRRRRVFIVGCAGDARGAGQVLFEPESCDGDSPPSREAGEGAARTATPGVAHSLRAQGQLAHREDIDTLIVADTLRSHPRPGSNSLGAVTVAPALTARYGKGTDSDASDALVPMAFMWQAGGNNSASGAYEEDFTPTMPRHQTIAVAYPLAMRGRDDGAELEMGEENIYNALRAGDGGSSRANLVMPPDMAVRRLMPVECERLQGFPDGWTDAETDSARYRLLGNAVCVPVAEWIGRRIVMADR